MIITECDNDLFNTPEGTIYAQCISSDLALGAGIALEFNNRYNIKERLTEKYPEGVVTYSGWKNTCVYEYPVFNLVVKEKHQGKPTYKTMEIALKEMKEQMEKFHIYEISIPAIGCGLDRLEWKKVKKLLFKVFANSDVTIHVYFNGSGLYENKRIELYPSHIEVYPYILGEAPTLEKQLSVWKEERKRYVPFGFSVENDTLLLPRGIQLNLLESIFPNAIINNYESDFLTKRQIPSYEMTSPPRDEHQEIFISFLTHKGEYNFHNGRCRFVLEAGTGRGKTYCAVSSILRKRKPALIITHQKKIQDQWLKTLFDMTTIPNEKVIFIQDGSLITDVIEGKLDGYIFITTHQLVMSYVSNHGWDSFNQFLKKAGIGVKIIDEAHLFFENILRIDFHTNVYESDYLTATFSRTDSRENRILRESFQDAVRYKDDNASRRKHIVYIPVLFNSYPNDFVLGKMQNKYGFSSNEYIDYALHKDKNQTLMKVFKDQFNKTVDIPGRTLVLSPLIESSNEFQREIEFHYPGKNVKSINSSIGPEEKAWASENADVISSTIRSSGTGTDIKRLRFLHCMEPHMSSTITTQVAGRLREYNDTDYTYMFDYFDVGIPQMSLMFKAHMRVMKKIAVKIQVLNYS